MSYFKIYISGISRLSLIICLLFSFQNLANKTIYAESVQTRPAPAIEIVTATIDMIETKPGKIVTVPVKIKNNCLTNLELWEEIHLPAYWEFVLNPHSFSLKSQQKKVNLIAFFIPKHCLAGDYTIRYQLSVTDELSGMGNKFNTEFQIKVLPTANLIITSLSRYPSLEYVLAGDKYIARYNLINDSNTAQEIIIEAKNLLNFPMEINKENIYLAPGESSVVEIAVQTSSEITRSCTNRISIFTILENQEIETQSYYTGDQFQIIPKISGSKDIFHRIPSQFAFQYQQDKLLKLQLSGHGLLNETGETKINYALSFHPSIFTGLTEKTDKSNLERDYSFCLENNQNEKLELSSVNANIYLNPLFKNDIFKDSLGIFYQKDGYQLRYYCSSPDQTERGYALSIGSHPFYNGWMIDLNYLKTISTQVSTDKSKDSVIDANQEVDMFGIQLKKEDFLNSIFPSEWNLFDASSLNFSYADGYVQKSSKKAFMGELKGRNESLCFSYGISFAESGFPGNNADRFSQYFNLSQDLGKHFSLNLHYQDFKQHSEFNTVNWQSIALNYHRDQIHAMIQYSNKSQFFNLCHEVDKKETDSLILNFWHKNHHYYFHGFYQLDNLNNLNINVGNHLDKFLVGENQIYLSIGQSLSDRQELEITYFAKSAHFLRFNGDSNLSFTGQFPLNDTIQFKANGCLDKKEALYSSVYLSFSLEYQLNDGLQLHLGEECEFVETQCDKERYGSPYVGIQYHHKFSNQGQLEIKGTYFIPSYLFGLNSRKEGIHSLEVGYQVPFGIPFGKKKDNGSIKGMVFDVENPNEGGMKGVIVQLSGQVTVTDSEGQFLFYNLPSDNYYLSLDYSSIGQDRISLLKMPIQVTLKQNETKEIKIGVIRKARIKGSITCYDFSSGLLSNQKNLIQKGGIANVYLELIHIEDGEKRNGITNLQGNFEFRDLRPGEYRLEIARECLPSYHYLEYNADIIIKPSETKEINIKVLPAKREIKMIKNEKKMITIFETKEHK